jgi:hypothetical protein
VSAGPAQSKALPAMDSMPVARPAREKGEELSGLLSGFRENLLNSLVENHRESVRQRPLPETARGEK